MESSDAQLEELRQALRDAEKRASEANAALQAAEKELERALPFEKEVKEKNLLIGKLRHEAVTLNDHLTKALRFLKRGKPEDNVDRYVAMSKRSFFVPTKPSDTSSPTIYYISLLSTARIRRSSRYCSSLQHSWAGLMVSADVFA